MAHLHNVYDTDKHFVIDSRKREIENQSLTKVSLIQNDHNSERFTFEIPRYIEEHDMSLCNKVEVHYLNIKDDTTERHADVYEVDDLQVSPDSDDVVICSWLISRNATKYIGTLHFALRFACLTDDIIDYDWRTGVYSSFQISETISNAETAVADYSDILEKWKQEVLASVIEIPTNVSAFTNDAGYTSINDVNSLIDAHGADAETHDDIRQAAANAYSIANNTRALAGDAYNLGILARDRLDAMTAELSAVAKSGSYNDLTDKPTNVGAFTNDVGYLTQHQDLSSYALKSDIPTVSDWAKQAEKPSYTADEVGALPLTGGNLNDDAEVKLTRYGNRFLTVNGDSLAFDMSSVGGMWATHLAMLKDAKGVERTLIGSFGSKDDGLSFIFFGGEYNNPHLKIDVDGNATFMNTPKVGGADMALKSDIPTVPTNVGAFTNDKGYLTAVPSEYVTETELAAKNYATKSDIPAVPTNTEVWTFTLEDGSTVTKAVYIG